MLFNTNSEVIELEINKVIDELEKQGLLCNQIYNRDLVMFIIAFIINFILFKYFLNNRE